MSSRVNDIVRALLQGDLERYGELTAGLDERRWNVFGEIVGSAFHRAVVLRFGEGGTEADIVRFVEEARRPYAGTAVEVEAPYAVALIRSVLGDTHGVAEVLERYDEPDLARIELVLLRRLLADAGVTGTAFEAFLEHAAGEARPWTGPPTGVIELPGATLSVAGEREA